MSDEKTGKGMFGSLLSGMGLGSRPGMAGMADVAMGLSQADLDTIQAQYSCHAAMMQGTNMQALGVSGVGMAPRPQPRLSVDDEEMAKVWAWLPAGSVLYVAHNAPYVGIRGPDGALAAWTDPARIPCLRAVSWPSFTSIEAQRAECEAAVKLLSVLAYGQPDALSVVVLERLS